MSDIKRITPDEVKAAYEKMGLKVKRGGYFPGVGGCACGLGAYAAAYLGVVPAMGEVGVSCAYFNAGFKRNYRMGFADAFDGDPENPKLQVEEYKFGYEDGLAAWEAVKDIAQGGVA